MLTTSSILPPEIQASLFNRMLSVKTPELIHRMGAYRTRLQRQGGNIIRFSRYERYPTSLVPLDGNDVPAITTTRTDIDATMQLYGQYTALNQTVVMWNQDEVLANVSQLLGLSMRMTEDQLTRDMLAATATVIYCTGGNNGDDPSNLSISDITNVTTLLQGNDAWMILRNQVGEDKFGTGPVRSAYIALAHTDINGQLESVANFLPSYNYPNPNDTLSSEWGSVNNVRFFTSSVGSISYAASGLGNNIYNIFIFGKEAYTCVEQDNFTSQIVYRGPEFSDALAQNVTMGWRAACAQRILNDQWICNLRTTLAL